ncbi:acetolactate synthase, small subunit [Leptospira inadai serovar Lyme str. 10]|uniref:Acetolactate synthase small subunit n=2 Tax=Leptospira inadai serovar Lyme TaxID=293084 RepID=V6HBH7_9LEPT|nr:acetolactate synthase small subunit [Leptospira inadai]EQA36782.1 acetolactate synthase, small subunit [Leptospira inadai serovar Lyme str. 10]PNV75714.1 acetolactate synthase small subunit [Leptospira inadai serovar Lyme]
MKHILKILVNNHPGVMSHVSGLFTRRSYNIDSIAVGVTDQPDVSSMVIVVKGDDSVVEQVKRQLLKLPDVIDVEDLAYHDCISRELVLVVVRSDDKNRTEIISICEVFQARIADLTQSSLTIEFSGNIRQVNAFIEMMQKYGIDEIARTGQIALRYRSM